MLANTLKVMTLGFISLIAGPLFAIGTDISCKSDAGAVASVVGRAFGRASLCLEDDCSTPFSAIGRVMIKPSAHGFCDYVGDHISFVHLGDGVYQVSAINATEGEVVNLLNCVRVDPSDGC